MKLIGGGSVIKGGLPSQVCFKPRRPRPKNTDISGVSNLCKIKLNVLLGLSCSPRNV